MNQHPDIERVLFTPGIIQTQVQKLAKQISKDYAKKDLMLVAILKGSVVFLSDLLRCLEVPCHVDFMSVTSYGNRTSSSGIVRLLMDLKDNPEGRNILLIEDILDTGLTMKYLLQILNARKPRSLKVCAFLDKPGNRQTAVQADYIGFKIPNHFVVGYGLDYQERYRNLPYVGILNKTKIKK